jgi:hypothetical protein
LLTQYLYDGGLRGDGDAYGFGIADRRLRLAVGLIPGISNPEHDEQRRNPEAVAKQGLNDDAARLSIDGRQDP